MQINRILHRHIFKGMISPFAINLVFLTFVFLMTRILDITKLIVNYRVGLGVVLRLLLYTIPLFLEFVIPMSVMMAVLLTFLRMSTDNEIVGLKAGGVSLYQMLPPVLLFCVLGGLLTGFMAIYGLPWGRLSFKTLALQMASAHFDAGLKERTFNDYFKGTMLYVNRIDLANNTLVDVFIEDQRRTNLVSTVVAPRGEVFAEPKALTARLRLYNGTINQVNLDARTVYTVAFDTYEVVLDLNKLIAAGRGGPKDEEEMSLQELRDYLREAPRQDSQYYLTLMELHTKFALPFACLSLGVLAVPLGIQSRSAKRSYGVGLGLVFFLVYYVLLSAGWVFGEAGVYPPVIGMWAPNIVLGGLGVVLLVRSANEKPMQFGFFPAFFKPRKA